MDVGKQDIKNMEFSEIWNPGIFRNMKWDYEMYASQLQIINFKHFYTLIAPAPFFLAVVEGKVNGLEEQEWPCYHQSNDKRDLSVEQECIMNKKLRQVLSS